MENNLWAVSNILFDEYWQAAHLDHTHNDLAVFLNETCLFSMVEEQTTRSFGQDDAESLQAQKLVIWSLNSVANNAQLISGRHEDIVI